ncbi:hypothetical protein H9654_08870 [Stenotrophomonas sp. Sa5BUN4]|uniref:Uncharacterized protein n=1 Tax=Stenotrophomonas lacuserhaii TaxID=2760084 RepID=A0A8X8FVL9_9GAMM|nr:hypothetical protein [Stenotrophomonas pennii]MBD7954318.1 hypothetical protein [Stenotrophomonas pennii]
MNDHSEMLQQRVERCEIETQAALGYIKALEYGLHSLIATLPHTSDLERLWAAILAEPRVTRKDQSASDLRCAAMRQAMAALTELIHSRRGVHPPMAEESTPHD